jgi:DNA-directed RNA polymerase specialized sigma24 family protein
VKLINVEVQMEKIKPEKAAEMLQRKGLDVTVEQAAAILEFMRKLAHIIVAHHLEKLRKR